MKSPSCIRQESTPWGFEAVFAFPQKRVLRRARINGSGSEVIPAVSKVWFGTEWSEDQILPEQSADLNHL